eukprot:scaffold1222_cov317-Pavlova_lutheri.AAC.28
MQTRKRIGVTKAKTTDFRPGREGELRERSLSAVSRETDGHKIQDRENKLASTRINSATMQHGT